MSAVIATPTQLQSKSRYYNAVTVTIRSGMPSVMVRSELSRVPGVADVEEVGAFNGGASYTLFPKGGRAIISEVGQHVRGHGWEVDELRVEPGRLDEVFRTITKADFEGGSR